MKRLLRPLVYILGFSVFCACTTTTKTVPAAQLLPSEDARDLALTLTGGEALSVTNAVVTTDNVKGEITAEDFEHLGQYVSAWSHEPSRVDGRTGKWTAHRVTIPLTDVHGFETESTTVNGSAVLAMVAILGISVVLCAVFCDFSFELSEW